MVIDTHTTNNGVSEIANKQSRTRTYKVRLDKEDRQYVQSLKWQSIDDEGVIIALLVKACRQQNITPVYPTAADDRSSNIPLAVAPSM